MNGRVERIRIQKERRLQMSGERIPADLPQVEAFAQKRLRISKYSFSLKMLLIVTNLLGVLVALVTTIPASVLSIVIVGVFFAPAFVFLLISIVELKDRLLGRTVTPLASERRLRKPASPFEE